MEQTEVQILSQLAEFGVVGFGIWLLYTGRLVTKSTFERERDRADRLEAENKEIRDGVEKDVIPLVTRAVDILTMVSRNLDSQWRSHRGGE